MPCTKLNRSLFCVESHHGGRRRPPIRNNDAMDAVMDHLAGTGNDVAAKNGTDRDAWAGIVPAIPPLANETASEITAMTTAPAPASATPSMGAGSGVPSTAPSLRPTLTDDGDGDIAGAVFPDDESPADTDSPNKSPTLAPNGIEKMATGAPTQPQTPPPTYAALPIGPINVMVLTDVHSWVMGHASHDHEDGALDVDYGHVLSFYQRLKARVDAYDPENPSDLYFVMNGDFLHGTFLGAGW